MRLRQTALILSGIAVIICASAAGYFYKQADLEWTIIESAMAVLNLGCFIAVRLSE